MSAEPEQPSSLFAERPPEAGGNGKPISSIWKWGLAIVIVGLAAYPIIHRLTGNPADDPNSAESQLNRSLQLYQSGQYQESITAAQAALKAKPDYALAYNNLAVDYLGLKKYDEAIQSAQQALRVQPDLELAKNNLAWIQQEKAKATAPPPVPLKPGTAAYFLQQSMEHYQAREYQQSIDAAQQALKLSPDLAAAYNNISVSYTGLGMWDKAIQSAEKALEIQPDFQLARNNLNMALDEKAKAAAGQKK